MANDINTQVPILNGDFNVSFSDEQHVQLLLLSKPGDFKFDPLLGIDITQEFNATLSPTRVQELERKIRLNLEADGASNIQVSINPSKQTILANAEY